MKKNLVIVESPAKSQDRKILGKNIRLSPVWTHCRFAIQRIRADVEGFQTKINFEGQKDVNKKLADLASKRNGLL
jgi:hypothetical protein